MEPETNVIIAYHDNCMDGFTSAWIAWNAHERMGWDMSKVSLYSINYREEEYQALADFIATTLPQAVYIVDFSIPTRITADILANPNLPDAFKIVTLDHHRPSWERFTELTPEQCPQFVAKGNKWEVHLDLHKSGAGITWDYFDENFFVFRGSNTPWLVRLVQDRDLWKFEYGDYSKALHLQLRKGEMIIDRWDAISRALDFTPITFAKYMDTALIELGEYHQLILSKAENFTIGTIGMYSAITVVEDNYSLYSDISEVIREKYPESVVILRPNWDGVAEELQVSLRSIGDIDVCKLAQRYGGGGHKNAAGFILNSAEAVEEFITATTGEPK